MLPFEDRIPIVIQTTRGDKSIYDVSIDEEVYAHNGKDIYKIIDIIESKKEDIYKVVYTDGRVAYYRLSELIYTGDHIVNFETIYRLKIQTLRDYPSLKTKIGNIQQYPIKYNEIEANDQICPDPYITGALLIYGDTSDPYVNLPLNSIAVNNLFAHKYNLNYGDKLGNDRVYFSFNGNSNEELITWEQFFPHHDVETFEDMIIPFDYRRGTILDRKQLIRGIFDIGYNPNYFPNTCSIFHPNEDKLKVVQKILWSLGVLSIIKYDPSITNYKKAVYRLDVASHYEMHPDFFYYIDFKEEMLTNRRYDNQPVFIHSIEKFGFGYSRNLVFREKKRLYLTDDFMGRLSI